MAEQEVAKHTKKIFKIWSSKEISFWHKLKEFVLEVFIIVFAITVSIWFHNRSEHSHQQLEVKEFLLGLKSDLQNDLVEMANDKESYARQSAIFTYITNRRSNKTLNPDTLSENWIWLTNTTELSPNSGRFEGFKSSGHIGQIENKDLQNDIMDLYQEDIVSLLASTDGYLSVKRRFFDFRMKNMKKLSDSTDNLQEILLTDEAQNICTALKSPEQLLGRYDNCIAKARKIISEIDAEYGLKD